MTPKINLSFALMVLIAFVTIQPCSAADYETVIMKPYKIILTTEGASDNTIQANIPMAVGIDISDFQAYLELAPRASNREQVEAIIEQLQPHAG